MRTNIDIDDVLMDQALQAGPFKTKKDAVEAGLKLLARQAAYREVAKWRGKLKWEGDDSVDWVAANRADDGLAVQETAAPAYKLPATPPQPVKPAKSLDPTASAQKATRGRR
jgi:Arc/MetJ family transcription regulator